MQVEVTAGDIKEGKQFNFHECPIALALNRACPLKLPVVWWVVGSSARVQLEYTYDHYRRFELPDYVRDFIRIFDSNGPNDVQPFSFPLEGTVEEIQAFAQRLCDWDAGRLAKP